MSTAMRQACSRRLMSLRAQADSRPSILSTQRALSVPHDGSYTPAGTELQQDRPGKGETALQQAGYQGQTLRSHHARLHYMYTRRSLSSSS